ncbi:hypothetical protein L3Q82_008902 [Scortum barcoo]|uniref:Uncharacterized protein n=1 Tax=Scortum barcoo TaxID=214431 RepID=A0ACB8XC97_9TELE|nr:hypothetical protein L3Q82_008902 [Scortum barcoo]
MGQNKLELNTLKTVEMTVDSSEGSPPTLPPLSIFNNTVSAVANFQVPGFHNLPGPEVGIKHQRHQEGGPAEDVLPCANSRTTKQDRNRLQRTVMTAEKIIGASLPSIQDLYVSRVRKRAADTKRRIQRKKQQQQRQPMQGNLPAMRAFRAGELCRALYSVFRHSGGFSVSCQYSGLWDSIVQMLLSPNQEVSLPEGAHCSNFMSLYVPLCMTCQPGSDMMTLLW